MDTVIAAWIFTGCVKSYFVLKAFKEQGITGKRANTALFCILFWPFMGGMKYGIQRSPK